MEPNPHPAQVPPAARSLQVHDKRRLGSTLSSNHILRHRKTCLSFPKTYFELLQTVSLFPKTTFCVNSNHGMKSVVYSPCSSNHILRHRKTCLWFFRVCFQGSLSYTGYQFHHLITLSQSGFLGENGLKCLKQGSKSREICLWRGSKFDVFLLCCGLRDQARPGRILPPIQE